MVVKALFYRDFIPIFFLILNQKIKNKKNKKEYQIFSYLFYKLHYFYKTITPIFVTVIHGHGTEQACRMSDTCRTRTRENLCLTRQIKCSIF